MAQVSAEESAKRWKILLERKLVAPSVDVPPSSLDPFDCSIVAVPSAQELVDTVLTAHVRQWKHLEDRKVQDDSSRKRKRSDESWKWGWHANRVRLPDHFDYATRRSAPPPDDECGERVVSLTDPSVLLSYEHELWKLFRSVPTLEQLEERILVDAKGMDMRMLHQEICQGLQQNSRLDGHGLARMRMRDRHGLPLTHHDAMRHTHVTTIRLECWRRQLKRAASPDPYRAELEFLGSQSLHDVHTAIVELSDDEMWREQLQGDAEKHTSGIFLIENTFYTCGSVDYVTPILEWLNETHPPRQSYLGLPSQEPLQIKPMKDARLDHLRWRLGVRYFHSHHGDVECSVFLTDVGHGLRTNVSLYPIVHDVWTPSYPTVECEACSHRAGVLVTSASNDNTDGGPRALCEACYRQLHPTDEQNKSPALVQNYSVWRDQVDLSVAHDVNDAPF